jgi:hypothetical protein
MTDSREKMLDKIRALLSKTTENGCTEEEYLAALAKARALMDANEITEADLQLTKEEGVVLRREMTGSDPHHIKWNMSRAVGDFCDCRAWRDRNGKFVFLGLASDTQFAAWLLDHLAAFVLTELAGHLMGDIAIGMPRRKVINGFVDGITGRISERLRELCKHPATASANSRALVVIKQTLIKAKLEELGIKLRTCSSSRQHDHGSFAAGRSAGDRASFGRPVSGRAATLRIGVKLRMTKPRRPMA